MVFFSLDSLRSGEDSQASVGGVREEKAVLRSLRDSKR